jgi:hypothetical protein
MLAQVHNRMLGREMTQQDSPVEDVAHVVTHVHRPARNEQRVFAVADVHRVDSHSAEQSAADATDVDLSLHLAGDPRLHVAPHLALAVLRLSQRKGDQKNDHHR